MNNDKIGLTIANLRKRNGLTQKKLSEMMSVSSKAISKWETGEGVPEITNLMELAKVFEVTVDYILQGLGFEGVENLETTHRRFNLLYKDDEILENKVNDIDEGDEKSSKKSDDEKQDDLGEDEKSDKDKKQKKLTTDQILKMVSNTATKAKNIATETLNDANKASLNRANSSGVNDGGQNVAVKKNKYFIGHWFSVLINIFFLVIMASSYNSNDPSLTIFSVVFVNIFGIAGIIMSVLSFAFNSNDRFSKHLSIYNIVITSLIIFAMTFLNIFLFSSMII